MSAADLDAMSISEVGLYLHMTSMPTTAEEAAEAEMRATIAERARSQTPGRVYRD